ILLVPEQATLQVERELIRTPDLPGFFRAQVLSFRRLAWRVFQESGGFARPHLSELGKRMALRALLERRKGELTLFGPLAGQPGFTEKLGHTMAELRVYQIKPGQLQKALEGLRVSGQGETTLGRKLHDLGLLYQALEDFLAGRYLDPDDYLTLLAERLSTAQFIRGAEIWADGFTGFTPQEEGVLKALLGSASRVNLTLTLDPATVGLALPETDLFHATAQTYRRVLSLAAEAGASLEAVVRLPRENMSPARKTGAGLTSGAGKASSFLGDGLGPGRRYGGSTSGEEKAPSLPRFVAAPDLAHLEAWFGRWPVRPYQGPVTGVKLVAAANLRAEVEAAARECIRLARDEGIRWREMAILARDLESYHDLVVNVFRDYDIPFFIDRRRPIAHHPLLELLRSALEVVREDWSYDSIFRYLKTDLVPVSREAVDQLENYVLEHGLRGRREWLKPDPWRYQRRLSLEEGLGANLAAGDDLASPPPELRKIDGIRQRATRALARFYDTVAGQDPPAPASPPDLTVRYLTEALFNLLIDLKVPRTLETWRRQAEVAGDLDAAQEHEQVWNGLVAVLNQLVEAAGDEVLSLEEYARVLEAGLEGLRLGLIPPSLDQVEVGSLDRSRQPEIQVAFVLGVGEGVLPARLQEDEIFSDAEREELQDRGLELATTSRLRLLHEQFLAYQALTRASRYLWVSYPLADEEGEALSPSPLVRWLKQVLPGLKESNEGLEIPRGEKGLDFLNNERQAVAQLLMVLGEGVAERTADLALWREVYRWVTQNPERVTRWGLLLRGISNQSPERRLPRELVAGLYQKPLQASVSRLETFAACPFQHLSTHGLRLRERALYQVDYPSMGQFYHAALRLFVEELQRNGEDWARISDDRVQEILQKVVAELTPSLKSGILASTSRYVYLKRRLLRALTRSLEVLKEHARRGGFQPYAVEVTFGQEARLPGLQVNLGDGRTVFLEGRIDRIDAAWFKGRLYLRIIDYKSSKTELKLESLYHGLSLQLWLYLRVILEALPVGAAGLAQSAKPGLWPEGPQDLIVPSKTGSGVLPAGLLYFAVRDPLLLLPGPVIQERELTTLRRKKMRVTGLLLADPEVIRMMDGEVDRNPDLLPVQIKRDGTFYKGSLVATEEQFQQLAELAWERARQMIAEMLDGEVARRPYRQGQKTACAFCPYRGVCRFDPRLPGNTYRQLTPLSQEEMWARLASKGAGSGA
ncbi:MAG: PD-(D/E)XK nuclease family protein, partial [Firmicutes bacterium]|nr:PD-(D/E)XK nuclease family protein [Bacillota bacterium]